MGQSIFLTLPGPWRIPIQLDTSLVPLALIFVVLSSGSGGVGIVDALVFFTLLIISILLHELGHAAACVIQKVPVTRIVLHGGGGFCQHSGRVTHKQNEFIAIAGPLVNIAIWAITVQLAQLDFATTTQTIILNGREIEIPARNPVYDILQDIGRVNLFLGLMNLAPVLPLDGGRILHSGLHRFFSPRRATVITGAVGVLTAILWLPGMIAAFLVFGFLLLFIPPVRQSWQMMRTGVLR